jgi:hypothetical protein
MGLTGGFDEKLAAGAGGWRSAPERQVKGPVEHDSQIRPLVVMRLNGRKRREPDVGDLKRTGFQLAKAPAAELDGDGVS